MKKIPLTKGKFALVDNEDYERLTAMKKWHFNSNGYAAKSKNYIKENGKRSCKELVMHRVIMGLSSGDGFEVDHINGDKLDNRKSNLRVCSSAENSRNKGLRKDNTSSYKGVHFHRPAGKFWARIVCEKKRISLGCFDDPKEAAKAYNEAALKYYGEFAKLNQI